MSARPHERPHTRMPRAPVIGLSCESGFRHVGLGPTAVSCVVTRRVDERDYCIACEVGIHRPSIYY